MQFDPAVLTLPSRWYARLAINGGCGDIAAVDAPSPLSEDNSAFGSSTDQQQFSAWLDERFDTYPCSVSHPQLTAQAKAPLARWRLALPRRVWRRFLKDDERAIKEINEICPIVERLMLHLEGRAAEAPFTIVDLCSGFGFLSMLLSEILDPNLVSAIHLLDRRWPMRGQQRSSDDSQSVEHIEATSCWRIPLLTRKVDVTKGREQKQLSEHIFSKAKGSVALLAVHLCGRLSCDAVNIFEANPSVSFLALKPCCLPGKGSVQHEMVWTLGSHTFTAADVYSGVECCEPCEMR